MRIILACVLRLRAAAVVCCLLACCLHSSPFVPAVSPAYLEQRTSLEGLCCAATPDTVDNHHPAPFLLPFSLLLVPR
jgi:hypothetical protein